MARDKIHKAVRIALEKDGWLITNDPFYDRRLNENNVSLIIIDITNEIVTQWIR